jgi:hypothetical protein
MLRRVATLSLMAWALGSSLGCDGKASVVPAGVGGAGGAGGSVVDYGGEGSWEVDSGSGGCDSTLYDPPVLKSPHLEECTKIDYLSNPPTGGPHYPRWANYQTYEEPVPLGYLVHGMEHGGVLLGYNCPNGCDAEVTKMQAFIDALADDPLCPMSVRVRLTLAPMPSLDVPFAVAAWGHMLKAQCFDETRVTKFVEDHYGKGPEEVCGAGFDPNDPAEQVPADCGK